VFVIFAIVMAVIIAGLVAFTWTLRRMSGRVSSTPVAEPDAPKSFGYKMSWLAVKTQDTERLSRVLGIGSGRTANWADGIASVYSEVGTDNDIFISPPVGEWTFVVGVALPHPLGASFLDKCTPLLEELSSKFGEAHYYFSFPLLDFYAWAKAVDGQMVRAFATGDEGIIWNRGRLTPEERKLNLRFFELRGISSRKGDVGGNMMLVPTEAQVLELAGRWSLDPSRLDERFERNMADGKAQLEDRDEWGRDDGAYEVGYLGQAPMAWRSERRQKSAA